MTPAQQTALEKGRAAFAAGRPAEARMKFKKALKGAPRNVEILQRLGMAEIACDRLDQGLKYLEQGARATRGDASAWQRLAVYLYRAGRMEEAREAIEAALAANADDVLSLRDFTIYARRDDLNAHPDRLTRLAAIAKAPGRSGEERAIACHGLSAAAEALGEHEAAMRHALAAGVLRGAATELAADKARRLVAACEARQTSPAYPGPVFIVGSPRSGTTLMEQILSRHPEVGACGESLAGREAEAAAIAWAAREEATPDPYRAAAALPDPALEVLAAKYLDRTGAARAGKPVWADKSPDNLSRLPLLARLFPNGRAIVMRRHPLDVAASAALQLFNDPAFSYTNSLATLADHLMGAEVLADAWAANAPMPVLTVAYETLVRAPEAEIRRILAFLALDWAPECLAPEAADRLVATASAAQVRQGFHAGSIGRWRRYRETLAPLIAALGGEAAVDAAYARHIAPRPDAA